MICFDGDGKEYWQAPEIARRFYDWLDNPLTDDHAIEGREHYNRALLIDQACWVLGKSPTIQASFQMYEELSNMTISAEEMATAGDYQSGKIRVKIAGDLLDDIVTMAHELRHGIQDIEGLLLHKRKNSRRCNVLLTEADAVTYEITVAYELRNIMPGLWGRLSKTSASYYALCDIFEKTVDECPDSLNNGVAANAVLENYISISFIRDSDFEYYFESADGFKRNISASKAFRSINAYYEALMGIPFRHSSTPHGEDIVERHAYLDPNPEDTKRVVDRLRGLVIC